MGSGPKNPEAEKKAQEYSALHEKKPGDFGYTGPVTLQAPPPAPPPLTGDFDQTKAGIGETGAAAAGTALMAPTTGENWFGAHTSQWDAPNAATGYWEGVAGKWNGGTPLVSNNAQGAYDLYMKNMPTISPDANMGGFYDNARTRQAQEMNTQLGARGAFNSSAALDKIAQGQAALNATQAKDEAQYGLDRASTMGDLYSKGGVMARGADASSLEGADFQRSWIDTMGDLASSADDSTLGFLKGGQDAAEGVTSGTVDSLTAAATAALGSQGARDSRIQGAFTNINKLGEQLAGVATDAYTRIISGDQALMDAALSGKVAQVAEALNISTADANRLMGDLKGVAEVAVAAKKVGA